MDKRKIFLLTDDGLEKEIKFTDLLNGNKFKIYESDGEYVGIAKATSDPYLPEDSNVLAVNCMFESNNKESEM